MYMVVGEFESAMEAGGDGAELRVLQVYEEFH